MLIIIISFIIFIILEIKKSKHNSKFIEKNNVLIFYTPEQIDQYLIKNGILFTDNKINYAEKANYRKISDATIKKINT